MVNDLLMLTTTLAHWLRNKLFYRRVNCAVLSLVSMNVSHIISDLEEGTKKKNTSSTNFIAIGGVCFQISCFCRIFNVRFLLVFYLEKTKKKKKKDSWILGSFLYFFFFQFGALYFSRNPAH